MSTEKPATYRKLNAEMERLAKAIDRSPHSDERNALLRRQAAVSDLREASVPRKQDDDGPRRRRIAAQG